MEEQNHLVKLACIILFVGLVMSITMYNVCRLMDDREKQLQAIEADNATLRLELASMSDAYQTDIASMNDAIIQLNEQINCVMEEMTTEENVEEDDIRSESTVPTYTLQNTETTEEVPPIVVAATRDDYGEENYSPAIITEETYDKFIEVDEEELVEEQEVVQEDTKAYYYYGTKELTAYCATGNACADGVYPSTGYTVASNDKNLWHKWVYIEGIGDRYVHDTGGMGVNVIDVYMDSYNECIQFGRQSADIYVYY